MRIDASMRTGGFGQNDAWLPDSGTGGERSRPCAMTGRCLRRTESKNCNHLTETNVEPCGLIKTRRI